MSKTKFTPGPWEVSSYAYDKGFWYVDGPDGRTIAQVRGRQGGTANAQLIAAAPDLLEACYIAWKDAQSKSVRCRLTQALYKATNDEAYAPKTQDGVKANRISEPGQAVEVESADGEGQEADDGQAGS